MLARIQSDKNKMLALCSRALILSVPGTIKRCRFGIWQNVKSVAWVLQKDDSGTELNRSIMQICRQQIRKVGFGRSWGTSEKASVDSKEAALFIQKSKVHTGWPVITAVMGLLHCAKNSSTFAYLRWRNVLQFKAILTRLSSCGLKGRTLYYTYGITQNNGTFCKK